MALKLSFLSDWVTDDDVMMFNETNCVEDFVELCADVIVLAIVIAADCVTETFEKRVIQAGVTSRVWWLRHAPASLPRLHELWYVQRLAYFRVVEVRLAVARISARDRGTQWWVALNSWAVPLQHTSHPNVPNVCILTRFCCFKTCYFHVVVKTWSVNKGTVREHKAIVIMKRNRTPKTFLKVVVRIQTDCPLYEVHFQHL